MFPKKEGVYYQLAGKFAFVSPAPILKENNPYKSSTYCLTGGVMITLEANRKALKSLGVIKLGLFGSCSRGEESATNDLDFVVQLETSSFDSYMDLKYFLKGSFTAPWRTLSWTTPSSQGYAPLS